VPAPAGKRHGWSMRSGADLGLRDLGFGPRRGPSDVSRSFEYRELLLGHYKGRTARLFSYSAFWEVMGVLGSFPI
jgi:hypothetical protein